MLQQQHRETLRQRLTRFLAEGRTRAQVEAAKRKPPPSLKEIQIADHRAIDAELAAVDRRIAEVDRVTARAGSGSASYELQELASERRCLRRLRREIEHDREHPIRTDRDGKPLDAHWRTVRRARAASLRESCWRQAERARAAGDHRAARRWRLDALRARHLAEAEMNWRNLSHYL